jgi:predicted MFS family arabinose efflux permease
MAVDTAVAAPQAASPRISGWLMSLITVACAFSAANLYYSQPLAGPIASALGLAPQVAGLIVTLTQIGYGAGLVLLVPLLDLIENRRLILLALALLVLALLGTVLSAQAPAFLAAALLMGLGAVVTQVLIPYVAHMTPEAVRGRVTGQIMSGVALGVMLARPVASLLADCLSWRAVFLLSACIMSALALPLRQALPRRVPAAGLSYAALLASMIRLASDTPLLRRRTLYQALLGGAFSLFWTTTPLLLAGPAFHLSQRGIGLFSLAGAGGIVAAPVAGRLADRGHGRSLTAAAMLAAAAAFLLVLRAEDGSLLSLCLLITAALLVDSSAAAGMVLGQRMLFTLGAEVRGRLNGLYAASFFTGGALGSALGGLVYAQAGWTFAACVGVTLPVIAGLRVRAE